MRLEQQEGRPYMKAVRFADELGVRYQLINGLVSQGKIEGFERTGSSGRPVYLVYSDQVEPFRRLMGTVANVEGST